MENRLATPSVNALSPVANGSVSVPSGLQGRNEAMAALLRLLYDRSTFTENDLSPLGQEELRQTALSALSQNQGIGYKNYPAGSKTSLEYLIGRTSPVGVRRVEIQGQPYLQVRDIYDFDYAPPITPASFLDDLRMVGNYGDVGAAMNIAKTAASRLGLRYGVNALLPEGEPVSRNALEDWRRATNYPVKNQKGRP